MSRPVGSRREHRGFRAFLAVLVLLASLLLAAGVPVSGQHAPDLSAYPWLYLRDGRALAAGEPAVEVVAVGDLMLGRGLAGVDDPFAAVAPWLRAAGLALGNLECVVAGGGTPRPGPYRLRAEPPAAAALGKAGFDLLGLANNHALDYGPDGLAETAFRLHEAGVGTVGAGPNAAEASQPVVHQVGRLRLAFLAFSAVPDPDDRHGQDGWTPARWDPARAAAAVAAARAEADAVVVSVHWGYEFELRPDPAQRDMARTLLAAGADLVVGHHPHVVQAIEAEWAGSAEPGVGGTSQASPGRFVAYSLGNFVFDQQQGEMRQGLALRAFFDGQGLRAVQALPVWAGPQPRLMRPGEAAPLLARLGVVGFGGANPSGSPHLGSGTLAGPLPPSTPALAPGSGGESGRLAFACEAGTCRQVEAAPGPGPGAFLAGEIDLTGDGVPELVRLEGEQVVVYQDGAEAWRGLPGWRVVDLALGDPNDDGRGEILLALWKPDEEGVSRSHPFVIGQRGGSYRILWGGSAVADPIHEVELGDLDGDGVEELAVLDETGPGDERAVTIWRWHGWGFSLLWRSPAGCYRDLVLGSDPDRSRPVVSVAVCP